MTAWLSRWHMPDWTRAEQLAPEVDGAELHGTARQLIDLVLARDSAALEHLPPEVRTQLTRCVEFLREAYDGDLTSVQFLAACLFVRRQLHPHTAGGPDEFRALVEALPA